MGTYIRSLLFSKCANKILVEKSHPISVRLLSYLTNDRSLRWTSRTHWCGKLTVENIGEHVQLAGWVQYSRLDNKFILIRDATGIIQLLIPEEGKIAHDVKEVLMKIGPESSINATGKVVGRPTGQSNPNMDTGSIEIELESVDFVNPAIKSLPFLPSRDTNEGKEPLRMKYRSLDLRRQNLQNNLRVRSKVIMDMRKFLCDHGFVDIETPTLFRRTPGGAREFIVPTRLRGKFYSLVQSPQQFKQMLMVGGFDKYFQVARCYRDEGSKPNRQPEFTQLDIEMAWCDRQGIQQCIEELLLNVLPNIVDSKSSSKTGER